MNDWLDLSFCPFHLIEQVFDHSYFAESNLKQYYSFEGKHPCGINLVLVASPLFLPWMPMMKMMKMMTTMI